MAAERRLRDVHERYLVYIDAGKGILTCFIIM